VSRREPHGERATAAGDRSDFTAAGPARHELLAADLRSLPAGVRRRPLFLSGRAGLHGAGWHTALSKLTDPSPRLRRVERQLPRDEQTLVYVSTGSAMARLRRDIDPSCLRDPASLPTMSLEELLIAKRGMDWNARHDDELDRLEREKEEYRARLGYY
jgi:hypothetical protein